MTGLAHLGSRLNDPGQHLNQTLKPLGYHTALCGVEHLEPGDERRAAFRLGYEDHVHPVDHGQAIARRAADWIGSRTAGTPWFLSVGFFETHRTAWGA